MPDERPTTGTLKDEIRALEHSIQKDRERLRELEQKERDGILDSLRPMINKCFRRSTDTVSGPIHEYACINRLPMPQVTKAGVHFNQYQLPSIRFVIAPGRFAPYEDSEQCYGVEPVFWFETLFTGDLPAEYRNGAINGISHGDWVEVTHTEFISAMEKRFQEFKQNLFEPTTPAW